MGIYCSMLLHLDRPADRLLTERLELVAGWIEDDQPDRSLSLLVGHRKLPLLRCVHPGLAGGWLPAGAQGFYAYVALQDAVGSVRSGFLAFDFVVDGETIQREILRVSPTAVELAERYPLDLGTYPVDGQCNPFPPSDPPRLIIFPSLGAVGGSSINSLFRFHMYRNQLDFPVFEEANDCALWGALRARGLHARIRWIDGHDCYATGDRQGPPWARITLLRNPLARMLTAFNYGRLVHPYEFPFNTFEQYLVSTRFRRQTMAYELLRIAGRASAGAEKNESVLYREAKTSLEQDYALAGITECFEESIFLICLLAELPTIGMWWRVLSTPSGFQIDDLSKDIRRRAEKALEVDFALYSEVKAKFSRLVEASGFGRELKSYKAQSRRRRELPDSYKMAECLRWRQVITESRLSQTAAASNFEAGRQPVRPVSQDEWQRGDS